MKIRASYNLALTFSLVVVYFSTARLGLTMAFVADQVTVVWPPSGIALAAVLLFGYRVFPGIAIGAFLANVATNAPVSAAIGIAIGNTLEAVVGAALIRRAVSFHRSLSRIRDSLSLIIFGAVGGTLVSAAIGVTSLCAARVEPWARFFDLIWVWWLGDAVGILIVTPLLLAAGTLSEVDWGVLSKRRIEAAGLFISLLATCLLAFFGILPLGASRPPLEYTVFPFVVWGALRFGRVGTSVVTFVASVLAVWGTLEGYGPFTAESTQQSLVLLQSYMCFVAVTGLLLSSAMNERAVLERRRAGDYSVSRLLATADRIEEVAPLILKDLCESLGWAVGCLWVFDPVRGGLTCSAFWNADHVNVPEFRRVSEDRLFEPGIGLPGRVFSSKQPLWISDVLKDTNFPRGPLAEREGLRGAFAIPIVSESEIYGVIEFFNEEMKRPDGDIIDAIQATTRQLGQFIERSKRLDAIQKSEEQLRLLTDGLPVVISFVDTERRYRYLNRQYENWIGRRREEVYGKTIREVVGDEVYEGVRPYFDRVLAGEQVKLESWLPNDPTRCVEATYVPHRDRNGRILGFFAVITDITARKRAEDALRESEERFRFMADRAPALIWLSDVNLRFLWVNKPWIEFVGRPIDLEVGDGWRENLHPDDRSHQEAVFEGAALARRPFTIEFRIRRRDGSYRWLLVNGIPLDGEDSDFSGYVGSCVDISDRREAERRLHEADKRKDEFLATLAHELRNPLAPIRNALQLISHPKAGPELHESSKQVIDRQLKQLVRLVDDLLDVSRITRGKVDLRRESFDLRSAISNAVEMSTPLIESFQHRLIVVQPDTPVLFHGDTFRLSQVIANLLNNAAKYTDRGGEIRLELSVLGDWVEVKVTDNGIGIAEDALPRIFDMFAQCHPHERGYGGLGLGLTLVRTLVELHHGAVSAQSAGRGKGTSVTVRLPLDCAPPDGKVATGVDESGEIPIFRPQRILVVDDNRDSADSLSLILKLFGHDVRTVYDGPSAVSEARSFHPGIILLDIGLPGMNGYEVARELRSDPRFKDLVLVAQTGWGQVHDRQRAKDAGFDHHLVKPIDTAQLLKLVGSANDSLGAILH
ncbi:MAG: MASE1 domain-containing protein [Bdellovibrionota bacterium]